MRILPIQRHMVHLMGNRLPDELDSNTVEAQAQCMQATRDALIRATGKDFGYDVLRWHQDLKSAEAPEEICSEYTWENRHDAFAAWQPNSEWQSVVEESERLALEFPHCPRCGAYPSLRGVLHRLPDTKEEMWLCKICDNQISISSLDRSRREDYKRL